MDVSRETLADLETFRDLLLRWTKSINLIAPSTAATAWDRHIVDSAQLFDILPPDTKTLVDLGSGGGLPGLVLAIMAKHTMPGLSVTLIESDQRKVTFLRTVIRALTLPATALADRIENVPPMDADVITARALAALPQLLTMSQPLLAPTGVAIFHKGRGFDKELDAAQADWTFDLTLHISQTEPDARLLQIGNIRRGNH